MSAFRNLDALFSFVAANVPVKLESQPGAGKTSLIKATHEASGAYLHDMVAVVHDPTDFGGIPVPDVPNERYRLLPGDWARDLSDAATSGQYAFATLFLDEVNTASRAVSSALLKVVDERRVGDFQLPTSVRMVLCVNPAASNGGVDLTPAMANRVGHLPFAFPIREWSRMLVDGFTASAITIPDDADIDAASADIRKTLAEYAVSNPSAIDDGFPDDPARQSGPFGTRRSWTLAARVVGAARVMGHGKRTENDCMAAMVGKDAADLFGRFAKSSELTDPASVLDDPDGWDIPADRADLVVKVLDGVTREAIGRFGTPDAHDAADAAARVYARVAEPVAMGGLGDPGSAVPFVKEYGKALRTVKNDTGTNLVSPSVKAALVPYKSVLRNLDAFDAAFED